ncbi:hypothetical protein OG806_49600 [Streptomyces sp. NBC_00882]|uniref:hypothetical protein n=1 Tax=Streptomyces sp. NBC_00882 TaxID=2975856 RepID=UPI0038649BD4|nr:hypothetical protein OG806_00350 [Streptomyces sp. NBC_00882]WSZ36873.1 hypothetical protein OG806_49600 [Streptomyces sp. NBC_00882]
MGIIVVEETRKQLGEDFGPGDAVTYTEKVHAAPADPAVPGDSGDTTLCGKPTQGMDPLSYTPSGPGAPWFPPNKRKWMCGDCNEALHSG